MNVKSLLKRVYSGTCTQADVRFVEGVLFDMLRDEQLTPEEIEENKRALEAHKAKFNPNQAEEDTKALVEDVVAELMHNGHTEEQARNMVNTPLRLQQIAREYGFI